jgi:hypothetical protein
MKVTTFTAAYDSLTDEGRRNVVTVHQLRSRVVIPFFSIYASTRALKFDSINCGV